MPRGGGKIVDWDAKRYSHFLEAGNSLLPHFRVIFPPASRLTGDHYPDDNPTWAWFLVNESGGHDKSTRLMNQFRALNLPAIKDRFGIFFDSQAELAAQYYGKPYGVLLPAWDLYLRRNIGFPESEVQMDPGARIRVNSATERCEVQRRGPDEYWQTSGMSFWNRESYGPYDIYADVILEYVCE